VTDVPGHRPTIATPPRESARLGRDRPRRTWWWLTHDDLVAGVGLSDPVGVDRGPLGQPGPAAPGVPNQREAGEVTAMAARLSQLFT
jgi:hypothetical protein